MREADLRVMEGSRAKDRKCYLFNDLLVLVKPSKGSKDHLKGMWSLGDIRVVDVADTDGTELFVMPVVPVLTRTRADLQHAFEICNKSTNAQKFSRK